MTDVTHLVPADGVGEVSDRRAADVMSTSLLTVTSETRMVEAATVMRRSGVHHVPVVAADGRVVGVLDPDLVSAASDDEPAAAVARRHLTVSVAPGDSLRFVAARLTEHGVDVAPVTTYDGRLVGLVTARDIVAAVAGALDQR